MNAQIMGLTIDRNKCLCMNGYNQVKKATMKKKALKEGLF